MRVTTIQEAFELAFTHHRAGRMAEAERLYRQVLAVQPGHAEAWHHLGILATHADRPELAISLIRRALELNPMQPAYYSNLGNALSKLGQLEEAISNYRRALELQPEFAAASNNLGNALRKHGKFDEAIAAYLHALETKPNYAEASYNLGNLFREQGRLDEAIAAYRRALSLRPGDAKSYNNLGGALAENDQIDDALAVYHRALQLQPDSAETENNLGNAFKSQGRMDEAVAAYRRASDLKPDHPGMHSNLIYALQFQSNEERSLIELEQTRWNRKFAGFGKSAVAYGNKRDPNRQLCIGYVSSEFRDHVTGYYLSPLFKHHDRENYKIVCYSGVVRPDRRTEYFQGRADVWRDIAEARDETVSKWIRRDGVDILVDLTQHLAGNRLPVFARRPAPVQMSFAAYPESTGLEEIPHRISDRYLHSEAAGSPRSGDEEHVFLIDSFWCYDACDVDLDVSDLPALKNGHVTFGCLNNFCKVNDWVVTLWSRLLKEVEESRLVLLSHSGSHREKTQRRFQELGVEPERIRFVSPRPRHGYFELYHEVDIAVDPFPCNGHTTSMDAMWMGVPVVSLAGQFPIARAGLSLLSNINMEERIVFSADDYVATAASLSDDLSRLSEMRKTLRSHLQASPLMNAKGFARSIETVYRTAWRRWCERTEA